MWLAQREEIIKNVGNSLARYSAIVKAGLGLVDIFASYLGDFLYNRFGVSSDLRQFSLGCAVKETSVNVLALVALLLLVV